MKALDFYEHHRWEIFFAGIFAIPLAYLADFLWVGVSLLILAVLLIESILRLRRRALGEVALNSREIRNSIQSHHVKVEKEIIAGPIERKKVLTENRRFHYRNPSGSHHVMRRLRLWPLLDGSQSFFPLLCKEMPEGFDFAGIDIILYIEKETNELFQYQFGFENCYQRTKSFRLVYNEQGTPRVKCLEREILQGAEVILLESLLIFPETLVETIRWIKEQGAIIRKVFVLFDATGQLIDFDACGIPREDVIIGCRIDLKVKDAATCGCKDGAKLKPLTYFDY